MIKKLKHITLSLALITNISCFQYSPFVHEYASGRKFLKIPEIKKIMGYEKAALMHQNGQIILRKEEKTTKLSESFFKLAKELAVSSKNQNMSYEKLSELEKKYNVDLQSGTFENMVIENFKYYNSHFKLDYNLVDSIDEENILTLNRYINFEKNSKANLSNKQIELLESYSSALTNYNKKNYDTNIKDITKKLESINFDSTQFKSFKNVENKLQDILLMSKVYKSITNMANYDMNKFRTKSFNNLVEETFSDIKEIEDLENGFHNNKNKWNKILDGFNYFVNKINKRRKDKIISTYSNEYEFERDLKNDESLVNNHNKLYKIRRKSLLNKLNPF